jgi:hypothetical protein
MGFSRNFTKKAVVRVEVVEFYITRFGDQIRETKSSARFALRLYNT